MGALAHTSSKNSIFFDENNVFKKNFQVILPTIFLLKSV